MSLPAEQSQRLNRGQVDENNTRNSTDQGERKGGGCNQSIEEVDETENTKSRGGTHYRSTFIDTQTLRRTWDKQYKYEIASKTARIVASSPTENTAVDASNSTASAASSSSVSSLGPTGNVVSTLYPNRPYTVMVRSSRTLKREDNVTKCNPATKAFRPPRTLQPPPGTFYKPPSGSKAKALQNCALTNSAEEEDEEEEELGIEIEVSVDEPLEEDAETQQPAMSESPSSSPEELGQNQAKPIYQRLRSRHLQEVEHREAHFV